MFHACRSTVCVCVCVCVCIFDYIVVEARGGKNRKRSKNMIERKREEIKVLSALEQRSVVSTIQRADLSDRTTDTTTQPQPTKQPTKQPTNQPNKTKRKHVHGPFWVRHHVLHGFPSSLLSRRRHGLQGLSRTVRTVP